MKLKRIVCLFAALLTLSASSAAPLADSDAPGEFRTLVKVYAAEGGALLASRQGLYPDRIFAP